MATHKDMPKDPVERLTKFLNKNFPGALKNKIKTVGDQIIIEINDMELSLATELFKQAQIKFGNIYLYELEDKIVLPKQQIEEIRRFIRDTYKKSVVPKPSILHAFGDQKHESKENIEKSEQNMEQKNRAEELRILNEYVNVPRKNLHTEPDKTPQSVAKEVNKTLQNLEQSLQQYINVDLKNPSRGHSIFGLTTAGSDQVAKKTIAQNILLKLENFNKLSISDPEYQTTYKELKIELKKAITDNKRAHGFWASLEGPGRLEKILLKVQDTLEKNSLEKLRKKH